MVSKNNLQERQLMDTKRVPRYSLRKLSIGLASVLLGTTLYWGTGILAHADVQSTSDPATTTSKNVTPESVDTKLAVHDTVQPAPANANEASTTSAPATTANGKRTFSSVTQSFDNGEVSLVANKSTVELKAQNSAEVDLTLKVTNLKPGDQYTVRVDPTPAVLSGEALDVSQGETTFSTDDQTNGDMVIDNITGSGTVTQQLKLTYENGIDINHKYKVQLYEAGSKDIYIQVLKNKQVIGVVKYTQIISPTLEKVTLDRTIPETKSVKQLLPNVNYTWSIKIQQHDGVTPGEPSITYYKDKIVQTNAAYDLPSPLINHGTVVTIPVPASFILDTAKTNAANQYGITATQAGEGKDVIITIPASQDLVNDLTSLKQDSEGLYIVGRFNISQTSTDQTVTASAPISVVEKIDNQGKVLKETGPIFQDIIMKKDVVPDGDVLNQTVAGAYSPWDSSSYKDPQIPQGTASNPDIIKTWSFGFSNQSAFQFNNTVLKMTVPEGCATTVIQLPDIAGITNYHYVLHLAGQADRSGTVKNGGTIDTTSVSHLVRGLDLSLGTVSPGEMTSVVSFQAQNESFGINFLGYVDHSVKVGTELTATVMATADELTSASVKEKTQQVVAPVMSNVRIDNQSYQNSIQPGAVQVGDIGVNLDNIDSNFTDTIYYFVLPVNAKLHEWDSESAFRLKDGTHANPQVTLFKADDGRTVVKVDYTNCGALQKINQTMSLDLDNLLDVGTSQSTFQIYAYSPNNQLVNDSEQNLAKVATDATTLSYVEGNRDAVFVGSGEWRTQVAKGLGLYEQSQGNADQGLSMAGRSHDFGSQAMTYTTTVRNFQDHELKDVTTVINLPDVNDGKSKFNFQLRGPLEIVNPETLQSVSGEVTYSTAQPMLSNEPVTAGTYVATPTDWTKVRSIKVVLPSLAAGDGVRFIMDGIDPTIAKDSGKTGYLSSVSWSQDWQAENGLKPYPIQVNSENAAKITVDGQKAIIKFVDQSGNELTDYPAITLNGIDDTRIPTDQIVQTVNQISDIRTPEGRRKYVFENIKDDEGEIHSDEGAIVSVFGNFDHNSNSDQTYIIRFKEQFDTQTATLTFVDDDQEGQSVGDQLTTKGNVATAISFTNGEQEFQTLINQGYEFVSAVNTTDATLPKVINNLPNAKFNDIQFGDYNSNSASGMSFVIHLKHGIKTVTAANDCQSGTPINSNDPQGVKYPSGVDKKSLTKTVNRTIKYVYADGSQAKSDYEDSLNYTATVDVDKVTGQVVANSVKWSSKQDFATVTSPIIKGYTLDKASVANQNIAYDSAPITETVTYQPDAQTATVNFVDNDTGKTLKSVTLNGHTAETASYRTTSDLQQLAAQGYVLVKDGYPAGGATYNNDDDVAQVYTVHLAHGTKQVQRTKQISRTIHFVDRQGHELRQSIVQTKTFTQTGTQDLVTNEIVWDPVDAQTFASLTVPVINGYHACQSTVPAAEVAFDDQDSTVKVEYDLLPSREIATTQSGGQNVTVSEQGQQGQNQPDQKQPGQSQQSLPQTGTDSGAAISALGLASLIGLFGLSRKKKQD